MAWAKLTTERRNMKLKNIFIYLILFSICKVCFSQENAKALKIDEIGKSSCEEIMSKIDIIYSEITKDSNSSGYVIIYGNKKDLLEKLRYESWINGYANFRNFDKTRFKVIRGEEREHLNVQFWKAPIDYKTQFFNEAKWNYLLSTLTKPFILYEYAWQDGLCPITSYVKLYADFLLENPHVKGHLVIRDKTIRNIRKKEKIILNELVNQYKVPRNRLKLFIDTDKNYPYDFTDVEFWLVPKNRN